MIVRIPPEILASICDLLPASDLPAVMLVNKDCYYYAERMFYSSIYLDFFDISKRLRSKRCVQTLSSYSSAAVAVRHLSARGLGLVDPSTYTSFITALSLAHNILSLDILLIVTPDGPFFPESLTRSIDFLPCLSALNVDDPGVVIQVVPGRPLHIVRVQDAIQEDAYDGVINALSRSAVSIKHLQLKLVTPGEHGILPSFLLISESFHSLISLGIQFLLPSPTLQWESLLDLLRSMASLLSPIRSLRVLSLVTLPDPILPFSEIHTLTKSAAEMIVRDHLPELHRIEARWHGWLTPAAAGDWIPLPQDKLLRRAWHFREAMAVKAFPHLSYLSPSSIV